MSERVAETAMWRVGRKLGRTLYFNEICVGMVDSIEMAESICAAMNDRSGEATRVQDGKPKAKPYRGGWVSHCDSCEVNNRPIARMRCPDCESKLGKHSADEHGFECGCPECVHITTRDRPAEAIPIEIAVCHRGTVGCIKMHHHEVCNDRRDTAEAKVSATSMAALRRLASDEEHLDIGDRVAIHAALAVLEDRPHAISKTPESRVMTGSANRDQAVNLGSLSTPGGGSEEPGILRPREATRERAHELARLRDDADPRCLVTYSGRRCVRPKDHAPGCDFERRPNEVPQDPLAIEAKRLLTSVADRLYGERFRSIVAQRSHDDVRNVLAILENARIRERAPNAPTDLIEFRRHVVEVWGVDGPYVDRFVDELVALRKVVEAARAFLRAEGACGPHEGIHSRALAAKIRAYGELSDMLAALPSSCDPKVKP